MEAADCKGEGRTSNVAAKHKAVEHDLKMVRTLVKIMGSAYWFQSVQQVELCRHLQSQLSSLRDEHQGTLNQLKEAHTLLERHVENTTRANHQEVSKCLCFTVY